MYSSCDRNKYCHANCRKGCIITRENVATISINVLCNSILYWYINLWSRGRSEFDFARTFRTIDPSDYWPFWPLTLRTIDPSNHWPFGLMNWHASYMILIFHDPLTSFDLHQVSRLRNFSQKIHILSCMSRIFIRKKEKKVVIVNSSTNINKANYQILPQIVEHKKNMAHGHGNQSPDLDRHKNVVVLNW